jgi:signal transduction histidine kinase
MAVQSPIRRSVVSHLLHYQRHPFRLLLFLEWILLGIVALTEFHLFNPLNPPFKHPFPPSHGDAAHLSWLTIASLIAFGVMGLRLPRQNLLTKVLYLGLGLGLIGVAVIAGGRGMPLLPSLLLILVIRSCLMFEPVGRILTAIVAFAAYLLLLVIPMQTAHLPPDALELPGRLPHRGHPLPLPPDLLPVRYVLTQDDFKALVWNLTLNSALLFGLVLVFVLLLVNALLSERQSRQQLATAHHQLHQYALRIEDQATLQERNRIAREIHDSLGHSLTAQSIQLENALLFLSSNPHKTETFLQEAQRLGASALQDVRQSVTTLRSDPLKGRSLEGAIALLIRNFHKTSDVSLDFVVDMRQPLPSDISTAAYRITQEALTNIAKHSSATHVVVQIATRTSNLSILIEDNGRGFDPTQNTTGFGLQAMQERTATLNGQFRLMSKPGNGCRIDVTLPIMVPRPI